MLDLRQYQMGIGETIYIRNGRYAEYDQGIINEIEHTYLWHMIPYASVETAIDVGAQVGAWSKHLRGVNPYCRIVTIEAEGENALICQLNHYGDADVFHYHAACYYDTEPLVIAKHNRNSGGHVVMRHADSSRHQKLSEYDVKPVTNLITFEDVLHDHKWDSIDLVKMDVEGSEVSILENMLDSTLARIKIIVGEFHTGRGAFDERIGARLNRAGFTMHYVPHPNPMVKDLGMFLAKR